VLPTSQKTHCLSITKTILLVMVKEIFPLYSDDNRKQKFTLREKCRGVYVKKFVHIVTTLLLIYAI
jgi:hypothetical protein